jgi:lysophospholipase L1-like esterase
LNDSLNRPTRPGLAALAILMLSLVAPDSRGFEEPTPWPLKDGDRVVLIGDTLVERDQRYGYLETFLTIENPELDLTFRNLGWSGDTVRGLSRAGFDPPEAGYDALKKQVRDAKPTVLIVGYGMADSFDGEAGLSRFEEGLDALLEAVAPPGVRLVLLSPIPHENLGPPLPDPAAHNRSLAQYSEAIRRVARKREARFVALLDWFDEVPWRHTDNGIHLTAAGYWEEGRAIRSRLGQDRSGMGRELTLNAEGKVLKSRRVEVSESKPIPHGLRLSLLFETLPAPAFPEEKQGAEGNVPSTRGQPELRVTGLAPGRHALRIDGREAAREDAAAWESGIPFPRDPEREQVETLRRTINEKNRLFFYRWRPQNMTYLFGFRKHEQGNNAVEIPKFDPLVEAKEREIARLRRPRPHVYEIVRVEEVAK